MARKNRTTILPYNKKNKENKLDWTVFFRLDESYTSLILGIVVVIFASIILVSFVKSRNSVQLHQETSSLSIAPTSIAENVPLTIFPTKANVQDKISITEAVKPVQVVNNAKITNNVLPKTDTYIVKQGDNLWSIAQLEYGSGYSWVDIAKANNLSNPDEIYAGSVLRMLRVAEQIEAGPNINQLTTAVSPNAAPAITGTAYTIQKGDCLWTIALRAYNDPYQWTKIASVNHLANPDLIYPANVLQIPRE